MVNLNLGKLVKLKKILSYILCAFVFSVIQTSISWSAQSTGKIETVRVCGSGNTTTNRWNDYLMFKMDDGTWYSIPGNYISHNIHNRDLDANLSHSVVLLAYSNRSDVSVSSNHASTACGMSSYQIWNHLDEFIELTHSN